MEIDLDSIMGFLKTFGIGAILILLFGGGIKKFFGNKIGEPTEAEKKVEKNLEDSKETTKETDDTIDGVKESHEDVKKNKEEREKKEGKFFIGDDNDE